MTADVYTFEPEATPARTYPVGGEDAEQAEWLARDLKHEIIYNHRTGVWHVFDPKSGLWRPDETGIVMDRVETLTRTRLYGLALAAGLGDRERNRLSKETRRLLDVARRKSALEALSVRDEYKTDGTIFDQKPYHLGCRNGVIDLRTATFMRGDVVRDLHVSKSAAVKWPVGREEEAVAEAAIFLDFLVDISSGDRALAIYLLSMAGYSLFGSTREEVFWVFSGRGRNGKGTLVKHLHWLLGDYAAFAPQSLYIRNRFGDPSADRPRPELLKLAGVRFTPTSEPVKGAFNDEMLKAHTGRDPITARALYSNHSVTFDPTFTLVFLAQDPPSVEDVGPSMRGRARIVHFEQDYDANGRKDPALADKLRAVGSGVLVILARAAAAYWANAGLPPDGEEADAVSAKASGLPENAKVAAWSADYIESNDPIAQFVDEACVVRPNERGAARALFDAYLDWHARSDLEGRPMTATAFGREFGKRYAKEKGHTIAYYLGVRPRGAMEGLAD